MMTQGEALRGIHERGQRAAFKIAEMIYRERPSGVTREIAAGEAISRLAAAAERSR